MRRVLPIPVPYPTRSRFNEFFDWLMDWEGRTYENDPSDRGGETKFGIDKRSHPDVDIKKLTEAEAKRIYWDEYWKPMAAELLPWRLAWVMADIAVNNGRTRSVRWAQEMSGGLVVDGRLGPKTLAALQADASRIRRALLARREKFYRTIGVGTQKKFLKGWLNRNKSLEEQIGLAVPE